MSLDLTDDKSTLVHGNGLVPSGPGVRHQAITWANVDPDLCRDVVSLGHNELTHVVPGELAKSYEIFWIMVSDITNVIPNYW